MKFICGVFAATGCLLFATGVPLLNNRVPPNRWYGFRTRATLSDSRIWYPANQYCGRWLIMVGSAMICLAVTLAVVPGVQEAFASMLMAFSTLGMIAWMLLACWMRVRAIQTDVANLPVVAEDTSHDARC